MSLSDGTALQWLSLFADDGRVNALTDGSILFHVYETAESATLIHVTGAGSSRRLGTIPRPVAGVFLSDDLKRSVLTTRDYFGDVWLMRVVPAGAK